MQATLSTACSTVSTDGNAVLTAGLRILTNIPSSFIWRLQTANIHRKLPITVDFWAKPSQPSNNDGVQFCLALNPTLNYFWDDYYCGSLYNAVCEIDIA